jgi:hypothetical protein
MMMYGRLGDSPPPAPLPNRLLSIYSRTAFPHPLFGMEDETSTGKYITDVAKITGITPAMFTFNGM